MDRHKIIEVSMGDGIVARAPQIVSTSGLGSCVVVTLYDTKQRRGGLAHIMLPDAHTVNGRHTPYQCADTAVASLLEALQSRGAIRRDMVAKMVGGARMFSCYEDLSTGIGEQNITSMKHLLKREGIPVIGEDIGGSHGRSVEFYLDSGRVMVMAIGKEAREI